jgi:uncharacterized protein (DUF58 family)
MANWQLFAFFGLLYAICWWMSKVIQARVNRFIEPAERSGRAAEDNDVPEEPRPTAKRPHVLRLYRQYLTRRGIQ